MIDFHCHLDLYPTPSKIIAEAAARKIFILAVTTTPLSCKALNELTRNCDQIRVAPGLHPELVPQRYSELPLLLNLIKISPYVGEVGIDGAPHLRKHLELQKHVFGRILAYCEQLGGRVISIHSRNATSDVLDLIEQHPGLGHPILHWFSGRTKELKRAIDLGCWFSINPGMLRSSKGKKNLESIPRNRILTESDGPFVEINGSSIFPWDVNLAEKTISETWKCSEEQVTEILMRNLQIIEQHAKTSIK